MTGNNSKMLFSDILTEFRGRSDGIRMHPLSFVEYYSAVDGDNQDAFDNYAFYGGMPLILSRLTDAAKITCLTSIESLTSSSKVADTKRKRSGKNVVALNTVKA